MAKSASHGRAPMGANPGDYGTHTMLAITNDTITWAHPQPLSFSSHHPLLPSVLLSPSLGCSLSRFVSLFSSLNLFFSISYTHITPHGVCSGSHYSLTQTSVLIMMGCQHNLQYRVLRMTHTQMYIPCGKMKWRRSISASTFNITLSFTHQEFDNLQMPTPDLQNKRSQ